MPSKFRYWNLDDILEKKPSFILVLDGVEDPHNFGAIIRTAEAAGVQCIVIRKVRQAPVTETVKIVSTGASDIVPIALVSNIAETVNKLKESGFLTVALEADGDTYYNEIGLKVPVALILGSEGFGVSQLVRKRCDKTVKIPMKGKINSLNASVAAGVVMYEVVRQLERGGFEPPKS
jgi:23S rRNA (guanosine2251-2'-O)-methyltransferase